MKLNALIATLMLGLLLTGSAMASDYALVGGKVRFQAPDAWPAIMQKTNGDPQFFAFQVRNPKAPDTLTRVTVTTHAISALGDFKAFAKKELADAQHATGYRAIDDRNSDPSTLHYSMDESGQRQVVRMSLFYRNGYAVVLRCVRPENAQATRQWLDAYRQGCASLANQLGH